MAQLTLLFPFVARAAEVAVFGPEISNLSPADADAVASLIAQAYASASQASVAAPSEARAALEPGHSYEAAAAKLGAKEYLRLSAVSAGRSLVISASRHRADGSLLQQAKQTSEGLEGVARDADSLAQALLGRASLAAPPRPIAAAPTDPMMLESPPDAKPRKEETDNFYGFKTGVHFPVAKDAKYWTGLSLQFVGRLQFPRFFLEFGAGFIVPTIIENRDSSCFSDPSTGATVCDGGDSANRGYIGGFTTELGASYYLTQGNVALYVGGGVIPRIVLAGLDNASHDIAGMLAYAQFGLTAPRRGSTHFFADVRLAQAILPQHLNSGEPVWSTEPSLHAGLAW
ncbi:MAG TPA: hypothetical protein VFZ61_04720 [Polyangiales bacterium]